VSPQPSTRGSPLANSDWNNGIDPQAWLADVLARINDHKITDLAALLPWNWRLTWLDRAA
jgi:hypothetical protein